MEKLDFHYIEPYNKNSLSLRQKQNFTEGFFYFHKNFV